MFLQLKKCYLLSMLQLQQTRARYLSNTEAPHTIEYLRVSGEVTFCFFENWRLGWGSNPRSPISKQVTLTTAPTAVPEPPF